MSSSFHLAFVLPADSPDVRIGQISEKDCIEKDCICVYGRGDEILAGLFVVLFFAAVAD